MHRTSYPNNQKKTQKKQKEIKKTDTTQDTRHPHGLEVTGNHAWEENWEGPSIPETSGCLDVPPTLLGNCGAGEVTGMVGGSSPVTVIM